MRILNFLKIFLLVGVFLAPHNQLAIAEKGKPKDITTIKKAIVTIQTRVSVSAYTETGSWDGTGFIVDKTNGYIMTNTHVVGRGAVGTYFLTFHNGQQTEAKAVYYDAYADFAILKVNPASFPSEIEEIKFADKEPKVGDEVFIVGNTEAQGFSFHTGYLSDLFDINGEMPQGSYIINMNTTGGASGSPIINSDSKAIGILFGGGKTHAIALKKAYLEYCLASFKQDMLPKRQHIGILTNLYSLDKAVKHRSFPKNIMDEYIKNFPDSRNRAISVRNVLNGSTAEGIIESGDIIWAVNGKQVAADLALVDDIFNKADGKVTLTIYRNGEKLEKEVNVYDLNANKVSKMFDFAGALFFEADDYSSAIAGVPLRSVIAANVQTGSSFSSIPEMYVQNYKSIYRIAVEELNGKKIASLNDLINASKDAIDKKYVSITYKNFQPYRPSFNGDALFISSHEKLVQDITFDTIDNKPRVIIFDATKNEWVSE